MNQNEIYSILKNSGLNADAILAAAKSGNSSALLSALSNSDRRKIEKALSDDAVKKIIANGGAKSILNDFGENNNGRFNK